MKLNLGCGSTTPPGWENVDYAIGARFAKLPGFGFLNRRLGWVRLDWSAAIRIHDLRRPFPWPDASADAVYSSHTFEHLSRAEGERFLREVFRVLKPGGLLRLVVPDLAHIVAEYVAGRIAADRFLDALHVAYGNGRGGWKGRLDPFIAFPHKCMYDESALLARVRAEGFLAEPRAPFDSAIEGIAEVELQERCEHAVIVEGRRPVHTPVSR
jgi:SAM-dependent methyltransferase